MMIPEAWENHAEMDAKRRAFYEFHSALMEPWDGPACVVVHRRHPGRRGPRPQRPAPVALLGHRRRPRRARLRGRRPRHRPGEGRPQGPAAAGPDVPRRHRGAPDHRGRGDQGRARRRAPVRRVAARRPDPARRHRPSASTSSTRHASVTRRQQIFGYTEEELRVLLTPDGQHRRRADRLDGHRHPDRGALATGRGCSSTTSASCSRRSPTRRWTRSARSWSPRLNGTIGPEANLLDPTPGVVPPGGAAVPGDHQRRAGQDPAHQPRRRHAGLHHPRLPRPVRRRRAAARRWPRGSTRSAQEVVRGDRRAARGSSCSPTGTATAEQAPIPSLLLTAAVHHHLVREKTRTQVGLLVEAGDVREVHHVALLIGYGAAAVNPYLAMESVEDLARDGYYVKTEPEEAVANLVKALGKGVLKVMSKMGVSTVASYTGAQIFEALGLSQEVVDKYFTGTTSKLGGIGLDMIAEEVARRHRRGVPARRHRARAPRARDRRRVPVAPRGRAAPVRPRDGLPAPARHPRGPLRRVQAVHRRGSTSSPSG